MHKFAIFVIDDIVEFINIDLIQDKWPDLCKALLKFSSHKACSVRQAAAYGIGVLSEKNPSAFKDVAT